MVRAERVQKKYKLLMSVAKAAGRSVSIGLGSLDAVLQAVAR